jgi:hypothetical protein
MKTCIYKYIFSVCLVFLTQNTRAQNPNWSVNTANYQYSMTFTTFLSVDGNILTSSNDKVAAFVNGELRGVANVVYATNANKYVAYLSVYANTNNESINFKIYNSANETVVDISKTQNFTIDKNIGGIFQSYSIASPALNVNAVLSSFNFSGITAISESISSNQVAILLPENTSVNSLVANFITSTNSKVFVNGILQESGVSSQDFTNPIPYKVLSEDEASLTEYAVTVTVSSNSNPTTVLISSSENTNTNATPVSLDIVFSNGVTDFKKSEFILENAIISSFNSMDSQNYKVEIVPLSQGSFSAQIPQGITYDINNNLNEMSNKMELNFDISKPIINNISVKENANSWWYSVTFSEAVLNVDISDFELKGVIANEFTISSISKSSKNLYRVNISNSSENIGTISLQLKSNTDIKDSAGNRIVNAEFEPYYLNNEALSVENYFTVSGFSMFPNPTSDFLNIKIQEGEIEQILLYDLNGKKVLSKKINKQQSIVDTQNLIRGIYFIKIIFNNGILTKKLLKI